MDQDPFEENNLAKNPEYTEVKTRLQKELKQWMKQQEDPGAAMDDPKVHAANRAAAKGRKRRKDELPRPSR